MSHPSSPQVRSSQQIFRLAWPLVRGDFHSGFVLVLALVVLGPTSLARAQEYTFTTLAGPGGGPGAVDGPVSVARFNTPLGVAVDGMGNMFVADSYNNMIRKIAPDGVVATLAGLAGSPGSADGIGSGARFNFPTGVAVDGGGNVYVADEYNHTIRRVTPGGAVTTLAGSAGQSGSANGTGGAARFSSPRGLAVDREGNVYVADIFNSTIRKITPGGVVTTFAGLAGSTGSADGTGSGVRFNYPFGVAVDGRGNLYVADSFNNTLRKIAPSGVVTTLAGQVGNPGSTDGTGGGAQFNDPIGVVADSTGNVYVADTGNHTIRKVTPEGIVTTLAGDPTPPDLTAHPFDSYADGAGSLARFNTPIALAVDSVDNVYVADSGNYAVRQVTANGAVTTLAGSARPGSDDGIGKAARFNYPTGVAADKTGNVFVADGINHTIRQVTSAGVVTTLAGAAGVSGSADGIKSAARFFGPRKLAVGSAGNLYVADTANSTIRQVTPAGVVTTLAGLVGSPGSNDGTGSDARFNALYDVALDSAGNLYVADKDNFTIRKVTAMGEVTTLAGLAGTPGNANGTGSAARFEYPRGVAVDNAGNVYVADTFNYTIRKVTPAGFVTTLAGLAGNAGSANGTGNAGRFNVPSGVAVDGAGNVFVADTYNNTIRKVTPTGVVTTLAGLVQLDPAGNPIVGSADGAGGSARFNNPRGIAVDGSGNVYVADSLNNTIRVGSTNSCPDQPIIDLASGPAMQRRQLDTSPQTASAWQWSVIRRPANSVAALSAANVRNPTFTPDVADLYVFQLQATNGNGAICIRTVSLAATPTPHPSILTPSLALDNGQFNFTIQSLTGNAVEILTSTNLVDWTSVEAPTNASGTVLFTAPAANLPRRFYRLRQL